MENRPKKWFAVGLALSMFCSLYGQTELLNTAEKLYKEGKYSECAEALAKEAERRDASPALLILAMNANLNAGNPYSASVLAGRILAAEKKPSLDLLYTTAECARLTGDTRLAQTRFRTFVMAPGAEKHEKLDEANAFLTSVGDYAAYPALLKAGKLSMNGAIGAIGSFIDQQNFVEFGQLMSVFSEAFADDPRFYSEVVNRLASRQWTPNFPVKKFWEALVACKYPNKRFNENTFWNLKNFVANQQKATTAEQLAYGKTFWEKNHKLSLYSGPYDATMTYGKDVNYQKKLAKEFAGMIQEAMKYPESLEGILDLLSRGSKKADFYDGIISPEQMAAMVNRFHEGRTNTVRDDILVRLNDNFYKGRAADANKFWRAVNADALRAQGMRYKIASDSANGKKYLEQYLAKCTDKYERLRADMALSGYLYDYGLKTDYKKGRIAAIAIGDYNPQGLANEFARKPDGAAQCVTEALKLCGYNNKIKDLLDWMGKTMKGNAEVQALIKKAPSMTKGSDPVLSASAKYFAGQMNGKDYFKNYKGNLVWNDWETQSVQELAAYKVMRNYWNSGNNNIDRSAEIVEVLLPHIKGPGEFYTQWINRMWPDQVRNKVFKKLLPQYLALIRANPDDGMGFDRFCKWDWCKKGEDKAIFADLYAAQPSNCWQFIANNAKFWSAGFYQKQVMKLIHDGNDKISESFIKDIVRFSRTDAKSPIKDKVPKEFAASLLKEMDAIGKKKGWYDSGAEMEVAIDCGCLKEFCEIASKRDAAGKADAVNAMGSRFGWGGASKENTEVFLNFADPVVESGAMNGKNINGSIFNLCRGVRNNGGLDGALRDKAGKILAGLCRDFYAGKVNVAGNPNHALDSLSENFALVKQLNPDARTMNNILMRMNAIIAANTTNWAVKNAINNVWNVIKDDGATPQVQYAFLNYATSTKTGKEVKADFLSALTGLKKYLPSMITVDKKDPAYPLFEAAGLRREGNALQAWSLTRDNFAVLAQRWKELDLDYVLWALDMARTQKMFKEGNELASAMWLDEQSLAADYAAQLALIKGDISRDEKNYPIAKLEYQTLKNNERCAKTDAGRMAKFRLVELLILTEDFDGARSNLEQLVDSHTLEDQAEAYYLLAKLEDSNNESENALENLKECFQRNPGHVEARLLEGQVKLKLGRISDQEIPVGTEVLATVQVPGKALNLLIMDKNLGVIRGGKSLPVLVTTTKGKDKELIQLLPGVTDLNQFTASVPTVLGAAVPGSGKIEVNGDDEIVYEIDPSFQKANGLNLPANRKVIRSAGKLFASSLPIDSIESQEAIRFQQMMGAGQEGWKSKTVRPGNPVYVCVVDEDMSRNPDKKDTVKVDLFCNSGDELLGFELTETGNTTGVFTGKVETGVPYPNVTASSAPEGQDLNAIINVNKKGSWTSAKKGSQWLEVDTMTSVQMKQIKLDMPNPDQISTIKLYGTLASGNQLLCSYPESKEKPKGGMLTYTHNSNERNESYQSMVAGFFKLDGTGEWNQDASYAGKKSDGWTVTYSTGSFYIPENKLLEFKFTQPETAKQSCYLAIDGKVVVGGKMNATGVNATGLIQLQKGVHKMVVVCNAFAKDSPYGVGIVNPDGSASPVPAEWFDPAKNEELMTYLSPKGKIKKTADGFVFDLSSKSRFRKFRWEFGPFTGNNLEVSKVKATDWSGKTVFPCKDDLSTGKTNQVLEIAPADKISVRYHDEKRLNPAKAVLSDTLSSAFANATIKMLYEDVHFSDKGDPISTYTEAKRIALGDTVMVEVADADESRGEEPGTIAVKVKTSSGETIDMTLGDDKYHRGTFREILKLRDATDAAKNQIKLAPGDTVTATYLDKENTHPGIPVERSATILNSITGKVSLKMFATETKIVEDKSPAAQAKIKRMRDKGDKREDIKIMKKIMESAPIKAGKDEIPVVDTRAPLLFELSYPDIAKHSGSTAVIEVLTKSEEDAAKAENREAVPLKVSCRITSAGNVARQGGYNTKVEGDARGPLDTGVFAGIVRLQLGTPGDEITDAASGNADFNVMQAGQTKMSAPKLPTVIVSGMDQITVSFKDDKDGKVLAQQKVQLRSDGNIELMDKNYVSVSDTIHLGQSFFVKVEDADRDLTAECDTLEVAVKATSGDTVKMKLLETAPHSAVFTGSLKCEVKPRPLTGETAPVKLDNNVLWATFGDKITFDYTDEFPLHGDKPEVRSKEGSIVLGSNGELAVFTKKFKDPEMAVKTNFLMAEALFEMAKSHRAMKDEAKKELANQEIAKGKRVLEEALRDYPDTKLKAQGDFLLANLAQQLEQYDKAISLYSSLLARYPQSEYAAKSQFQKAVCLEKLNQMLSACEEFVKLTYLYPNDKLAADAKIRLANHYYKQKRYAAACTIFYRFAQAHPDHALASKGMMLAGYAATKAEQEKEVESQRLIDEGKAKGYAYKGDYKRAINIFTELLDKFPDDKQMRPEAMYWAGTLLFKDQTRISQRKSYQLLQRLIWEYPESQWAKLARGRLAESQQ